MRDSRVRLRERAMQLVRGKMRENDRRSMRVGRLRRRSWSVGFSGGWVERPLEKMDVCARSSCFSIFLRGLFGLLGLLSGEREDELRIVARGGGNALVRF